MYDKQLIDDALRKLTWKRLHEKTVVHSDTLIDKRIGEVLDREVDYTRWKYKY